MKMYDENSIKVLNHLEIRKKFSWANSREIALKYNKPHQFVEKLLKACERLNMDSEDVVERYLGGNKSIPRNIELESVYRELLKE